MIIKIEKHKYFIKPKSKRFIILLHKMWTLTYIPCSTECTVPVWPGNVGFVEYPVHQHYKC